MTDIQCQSDSIKGTDAIDNYATNERRDLKCRDRPVIDSRQALRTESPLRDARTIGRCQQQAAGVEHGVAMLLGRQACEQQRKIVSHEHCTAIAPLRCR